MTCPPLRDPIGSAAVMLMLLDDEEAAQILSRFDPDELRLLGETMCALGEIDSESISTAISGFVERTEELGLGGHDRVGRVRSMMTQAVGDLKADNLMQRIAPETQNASSLELARWLTPQSLAPLILDEPPQMIAVLLVQIDPQVAAEVLHMLPEDKQRDVVHRVATLGPINPGALAMLEELLAKRISASHGHAALTIGGPKEAAEIINNSGKAVEKRIMPQIAKIDKALARKIEGEMFKFEHLFELDPQAMGTLLRSIESETLIDALKGIAEDERDVFFASMSSRAADGVKDEIAARGRVKLEDVVNAQKAIVDEARKLAADGEISFGAGDDDYV